MADLTPEIIFAELLPKRLAADPAKVAGLEAVYKFELDGEGGGTWFIVCDGSTGTITAEEQESQCTISMDAGDFVEMIGGGLNPQMAFMTGKLRVAGDIGLALKIQTLLA